MKLSKAGRETSDQVDSCTICIGAFRNKSRINSCDHVFCFKCISRWAKRQKNCPICRGEFDAIVSKNNRVTRFAKTIQAPRPQRPIFSLPVLTIFMPVMSVGYSSIWQLPPWPTNDFTIPLIQHMPIDTQQI